MNIEQIYKELINGHVSIKNIEECAAGGNFEVLEVFNKIALLFASRFHSGLETYENADNAMNQIWSLAIDYIIKNEIALPEPCFSVYSAFDEGEYIHPDNLDPVETYTKPQIAAILKEQLHQSEL